MTKVDVISGFLGAGKTTLISKLIKDVFHGQKVVLVENEFGEIGIDGGFLKESGIEIREINSGCICCTLKGDFEKSLQQVIDTYHPDRIIIEPSGVGKLSDILRAVKTVSGVELDSYSTVVDAARCKVYHRNFKEFFDDQIATASCVILSKTQNVDEAKLEADTEIIREHIPLPSSIGRICPHPCEDNCRRGLVDQPLSICALKAYASDRDYESDDPFKSKRIDCSIDVTYEDLIGNSYSQKVEMVFLIHHTKIDLLYYFISPPVLMEGGIDSCGVELH